MELENGDISLDEISSSLQVRFNCSWTITLLQATSFDLLVVSYLGLSFLSRSDGTIEGRSGQYPLGSMGVGAIECRRLSGRHIDMGGTDLALASLKPAVIRLTILSYRTYCYDKIQVAETKL